MDDGEECLGRKSVKHTIRDIKSERFVAVAFIIYFIYYIFYLFILGVKHLKHLSRVMSAAGKPNLSPSSK